MINTDSDVMRSGTT